MSGPGIVNLSAESPGKLHSWLPQGLSADTVVFLPDACPGKSPLPTGTAVLTQQMDWRRFALSDCGCGMRLLRSNRTSGDISVEQWDAVARLLQANKGQLGDLGGGNHFLDALEPYGGDRLHFLVHTGARAESGLVDMYVDSPVDFDREFNRVRDWAESNRAAVQESIEKVFGHLDVVLDLPHNTFEIMPDGAVLIRKGAVKAEPGSLNIIPSNMAGDVALVSATDKVREILCSLSHGTGRAMARADCKPIADNYDFAALRSRVMIPTCVQDASLRTEGPFAYRNLDACLALMEGYVEEVERYSVIAYMGHL